MNIETDRLFRTFEAVGHASRFRIVLALCERERHVSELALEIGLSQSCTTRHLQALERAEVIRTRRAGKRVLAALALERERIAQLVGWLRDTGVPDAYTTPARAPAPTTSETTHDRTPKARRGRRPSNSNPNAGRPAPDPSPLSGAPEPSSSPAPERPSRDLEDFLL